MTASLKTCPFCAEEIAAEAIKCKHCGTVLEARPDASGPVFDYPPATLTIPMLVSAGWNIVTALVWSVALPCLGFVVALPYAALALFEILTFQKAPMMTPRQLYDRCGWLGGIQIFLGLTNLVPVICGIFLFAFRDRLLEYHPLAAGTSPED